jgi:hypothetical protein
MCSQNSESVRIRWFGIRTPVGAKFSTSFQTQCPVCQVTGLFPGNKPPARGVGKLPPSSVGVKHGYACTFTLFTVPPMACYRINIIPYVRHDLTFNTKNFTNEK